MNEQTQNTVTQNQKTEPQKKEEGGAHDDQINADVPLFSYTFARKTQKDNRRRRTPGAV